MKKTHPIIIGIGLPLIWACTIVAASAADAPVAESLLAEDSVAYLRFDGLQQHEEALSETVLGDIFNEHLEPLYEHVKTLMLAEFEPTALGENLLPADSPEGLAQLQKAAQGLPLALGHLYSHGAVIGVQLQAKPQQEPQFQVTVVFSDVAQDADAAALLAAIQLLAISEREKVEHLKIQGRDVVSFEMDGQKFCGWREGDRVVWTMGSLPVERTIDRAEGKGRSLADSEVYKEFGQFDRYATYARGYFDTGLIAETVQQIFPPAREIVKQAGIDGLQRIAFHLGYEGKYQRSTVSLHLPGDRAGVLQLVDGLQPVKVDQLPPIAPDASYVATTGLGVQPTYDIALNLIEMLLRFSGEGTGDEVRNGIKEIEDQLGIDIRNDILGEVGPPLVIYSSPSEGPFSIGSVVLMKVQNENKLTARLDMLLKTLGAAIGEEVQIKTTRYKGAFIRSVRIGGEFPFRPSYTVYKGWLAVALYPQPIQGYVLRAGGGYRTWEPSALVADALKAEEKYRSERTRKVVGISQSDPRPTVTALVSVVPMFGAMASAFGGGDDDEEAFDFSLIPNAQAINEHVTPGVTVTIDDGEDLRLETYSSLPLGFQLTGLQSYFLAFMPFMFAAF